MRDVRVLDYSSVECSNKTGLVIVSESTEEWKPLLQVGQKNFKWKHSGTQEVG